MNINVNCHSSIKIGNIYVDPFKIKEESSDAKYIFITHSHFDHYSLEDIKKIVIRTSKVYDNLMPEDAAEELARRSRGTPRIANRLFRRVRDFATVVNNGEIDLEVTKTALNALKVDELGLDDVDIRFLKGIIERFKGGPVGIESIAAAIGEEEVTLEDVYEPYLLQQGLINRTPRGRMVTEKAYKHLKIPYQSTLF